MSEWTTITVRRTTLLKLKELYKAYGGNRRFGSFLSFLELIIDVFLLVDPEVVLKVFFQKHYGKSNEFLESLEGLRRNYQVKGEVIRPVVPERPPPTQLKEEVVEETIEVLDEHML